MKIFTIDTENNISVFTDSEEAAAAISSARSGSPFETFSNQKELERRATKWPAERMIAIWNSLTGVEPVQSFKTAKTAAKRIWGQIQSLGDTPDPTTKPRARVGVRAAKGATAKAKPTKRATTSKVQTKAAKDRGIAKRAKRAVRSGSKTMSVIVLLERKGGATLHEIMKATGWQAHSVRGFISGTLGKKMGRRVESSKREDGARMYQLKN